MDRFTGKTALITGGTTGIGYATAERLLAEGARVAVTGQNADRVAEAAQALGVNAIGIVADVRSPAALREMASKVEEAFGGLDVVFANAGIAKFAPLTETDEAFFDEQFDTNVKGVFFTLQAVLPVLRDGASIVLTSSIVNQTGMAGAVVYSATKAAVRSIARTLSAELVDRGIRVNVVSPGPIETPIFSKMDMPQEEKDGVAAQLIGKVPMARFGKPEEIAGAVAFLASTDASFILGGELSVDGGWTNL